MCFFIYGDELYMTFLYWPVDKVNYIDCFLNIEPTLLHFQDKHHLVMIFLNILLESICENYFSVYEEY